MDEVCDRMLLPIWTQVAQRHRDRSDYVLYEILNEPFGIDARRRGEVQGRAIETIRRYDTKHTYPYRKLVVWGNNGENIDFSLFDTNSSNGEFAIRWGNADRYKLFYFHFDRNENFTQLVSEGYCLELKVRATGSVSFDVFFTNFENHIPWRMRYTINIPTGGVWQTIRVPLRNMQEQGAWVETTQQWLTPRGEFSWGNVMDLVFHAEQQDMKGITVWIDDIKITR